MDDLLRQEVRFLTTRLGAIVQEQCGPKTFRAVETLRQLAKQIRQNPHPELIAAKETAASKLSLARAEDVAHAFSLFFHLVNLCEERQRVRRLEAYDRQEAGAPMSLKHTFAQLARQDVSPQRVARLLATMRVEPVLTAHPTEAKRRSVLNHILRIGRTLETLRNDPDVSTEHAAGAIDPWIEALWLTDEMRERPVTPEVEIESTLVFLERTIYDLAGVFWEKLEREWSRFAPRLKLPPPFLGFGSWVGTDRDGNPHVTPETSLQAAERQRLSILDYYRQTCEGLLQLVPFPCRRKPLEKQIRRDIRAGSAAVPRDASLSETRPAARALSLETSNHDLETRANRGARFWSLSGRIRVCARRRGTRTTPGKASQPSSSARWPRPVARGSANLRLPCRAPRFPPTFVRHACGGRGIAHCRAPRRLTRTSTDPVHPEAARWPGNRASTVRLSAAARRTLDEFQTLKLIQNRAGEAAASPYILSMTSSASDVWDALLLGRPRRSYRDCAGGRLRSSFDVVPLFETVNDLEACPNILESLLSDPLYRRMLRSRGNFQEVMLGYSDSVKDSGYLAANLALFRAQKRLGRVAERHGVRLGLFHGKGGTIDRGGGQSYRSIQAQPYAAPGGGIRITEQGEVISLKYSHLTIAERNLEQLVTSVLDAHLLAAENLPDARRARWEEYAAELAASSRDFYRQLVYETPEFH